MSTKNKKRNTVPAEISLLATGVIPDAEVITVTTELAFNKDDEGKLLSELTIVDTKLSFHTDEEEKRSDELNLANTELAFQTKEREKRAAELIIANTELAYQNEEKEKRAAERSIADTELAYQNTEKEKRAAELIVANTELAFQNKEKDKRAAELLVANKELAFQNAEKEKRAAELLVANTELAFQNAEKEKRAAELLIANKELAFQNSEKDKRAAELIVANKELAFQNEEKGKRAAELLIVREQAFRNEEREKRALELSIANVLLENQIHERKQAEQLLLQERERLSITLRSIADGVITTDTQGLVVMLNKAAEKMTGWKLEDAVGRPLPEIFNIVDELTRERCENPVEKILSTGGIIELANHTWLISKTGEEIQIGDSGAPIRDVESRVTGVVLVFRDMTEKQRLSDSMQRAQKLESLGVLAGGIAHDFNNMLAGIFGYLDMANNCLATNQFEQISNYLNKALGAFDRAKGLTQQLLTFSKGGAPVRKTVQIVPIIRHSSNFALSGANVTCLLDLPSDLWLCDCDENQIGQVIDNLVINGMQAMPMGGTIYITAVNVKEMLGHQGEFVRISVKDEGPGIPAEIIPKIFDPFFSTKTTGHGLGLATVFSIVKRHDGWIDLESTVGRGSTFHVFIPASQKNGLSSAEEETVRHRGSGTILIMDDEESLLEIVGSMLQTMGYSIVPVKDGQEALARFIDAERLGQPFAASILDLTIPGGIGGKETAVAMRKINPNSIIIVSSGYSEDPVISNPTGNGFTDRIIKPYRKDELTELMIRVLRSADRKQSPDASHVTQAQPVIGRAT